jgi:hypothetical protein
MVGRARLSRRSRGCRAALAVLVTAGTACSASTHGRGSPVSTSARASASTAATTPSSTAPTVSSSASKSVAASSCPSSLLPPDPDRPTVKLIFTLSNDLRSVHGTEHVTFTPDRPITELVFRLTANTEPTVAQGNRIQVDSARADHGAGRATFTAAGAAFGTQGGLLHIPFAAPVGAATTVTADIAFDVTLGQNSFDRFGRAAAPGSAAGTYAWFASAQPLLAWERGYGWHTEPMIKFTAESATSEAMQTDLTVTAPGGDVVIMSGDPTSPTAAAGGRRTWHATIAAARDVSVAVGPFSVTDTKVGSVKVRVGAYTPAERDRLVPEIERAITQLAARFGPFPFPSLSVARVPGNGGGIEYPSSILMLANTRLVAVHETAHQWFYAMVGDSQAQHAWLDEAFASYAEQLVDNDGPPASALDLVGAVDRPTASYGLNVSGYYRTTYDKGAAALHAARQATGAAAFDRAIRCYVNANAWRIVNPADLSAALAKLPVAVAVLKRAGALH